MKDQPTPTEYGIAVHPVCDLFPLMNPTDLAALEKDIREHGLKVPLFIHKDQLIDGRNRLLACRHIGIEPRFEAWNGKGSLVAFAWSVNGQRRHLTPTQKATIAVEMLPLLEKEAEQERIGKIERDSTGRFKPSTQKIGLSNKARHEGEAAAQAAEITGTNRQYVAEAKELKENEPEEFEKLKSGETTLALVMRKKKEQKREARRKQNRDKVAAVPRVDVITAQAKFATIVIDPPWDWGDEGDNDQLGRANPEYATMPIAELLALPVNDLADVDCHMYLWITNRSLPKGFPLLERWGFRYVTALTWVKPSFGMGNYFRGQTEHVLFAIRGSQALKRKDASTVLFADRGKAHSEKPALFYELVETCSPGPYLEMFSRSQRNDWTSWGESSAA